MINHLALLLSLLGGPRLLGQESGPSAPLSAESEPQGEGMVWYTNWGQALEEAGRTGRPMFLMSAAPRCHDVPGLW